MHFAAWKLPIPCEEEADVDLQSSKSLARESHTISFTFTICVLHNILDYFDQQMLLPQKE